MKHKIVVTNRVFPETLQLLQQYAEVDVNDAVEPWPPAEVRTRCRNADGLLAFMSDRIDEEFLTSCPRLRVIGAALKGYDNIDVAAAEKAGVWVTVVPDLLTIPTAELTIGLMLCLGRHILKGDRSIRENGFGGWRPLFYGAGIDGATVGIVGFGLVGQAIAERLATFHCKLIVSDGSNITLPNNLRRSVSILSFDALLSQSDYLVLALPLHETTQHIINRTSITAMKHGAFLINTARGSLVDENAVADALETGQLAGYAADVFECEDWARPDRPAEVERRLTEQAARTVLTPHLGSAVGPVRKEIELAAARSIIEALGGRRPDGAVNDVSDTRTLWPV